MMNYENELLSLFPLQLQTADRAGRNAPLNALAIGLRNTGSHVMADDMPLNHLSAGGATDSCYLAGIG